MLVIYPFHSNDQDRALRTAQWIQFLGTVEAHQCLIVHDKFTDPDIAADIESQLTIAFRHTVRMPLREGAPGTRGMNLLFRRAARQVQSSAAGPFLWLNPDAIPLRQGWLDAIEVAWQMLPKGKKFLGCHVANGGSPHMAGVGVYPQDAEVEAPNLVMADANPFYLNAAPQVVPKMAHTELIADTHLPALITLREGTPPMLPEKAVLWHGSSECKDGSLIQSLEILLEQGHCGPLPIVTPKPDRNNNNGTSENGNGKFSVPLNPMNVDRSAAKAASMAGSDGIPSDEIDTSTQVPGIKPPNITPIAARKIERAERVAADMGLQPRVSPIIAEGIVKEASETAAILTTAAAGVSEAANLNRQPAAEDVTAICNSLAAIRDNSPADKARVLAALRAAGFSITGKQKAKP